MLGEREAMVLEVHGLDIHGIGYVDVTVGFRGGDTATARLGRESVPDDLRAGEVVRVSSAMSVVVAIRRAGEGPDGPDPSPSAPG